MVRYKILNQHRISNLEMWFKEEPLAQSRAKSIGLLRKAT